jgi:hypothetical protein
MAGIGPKKVYHNLVIEGAKATVEIVLTDELGFYVQSEKGALDTRLLPGLYIVDFGSKALSYPIKLTGDCRFTQADLERGPTCTRPIPVLADED